MNGRVIDASISDDEKFVAVSYNDNSPYSIIELYDAASRRLLYRWYASKTSRVDLNFTPDGKKLVICKIHDNTTWNIFICSTSDYSYEAYDIAGKAPNYLIGKDSRTIYAVETPGDRVVIREIISGKIITTVINDFGWENASAFFSRSGDLAVLDTGRQEGVGAATAGRFVYQCIDLKTGKTLFKAEGTDYISNVAFSSDGNFVAIQIGSDKACQLWDINNGTKTEILTEDYLLDMVFAHNNSSLLLIENYYDKTSITSVKLYTAQEALNKAKAILQDTGLTSEEKVKYFVSDLTYRSGKTD